MLIPLSPAPLAVLLVEDNPGDADLIRYLISEIDPAGFTFRNESTLTGGLAAVDNGHFDVVLLDLNLPDSSGIETVERMVTACPGLPVVILTGNPDDRMALQTLRGKAQDCLVKGYVTGRSIIRAIRYALERNALQADHDRFLDILNASTNEISLVDRATLKFFYVNQPFCRNIGYTAEELREMTPFDLNPDLTSDKDLHLMEPLLGGTRSAMILTTRHRRRDGSLYPLELHLQLIRSGSEAYVLGVGHDITDRLLRERELEESNARLRQALHNNEILIKEIHHRVKNNLALVASLLNLQTSLVHDPRDADLLQESRSRVMTMARIHENLYRSDSLTEVDAVTYLRSIACQVIRSGSRHGIDLVVDGDELTLSTETAVPLGLMLNELVTNSLKHAFPDRERGLITVHLASDGNGCRLTYRDNGIGFPEILHHPSQAETLGLMLVYSLARQISGTLRLDSEGGARINIVFPLY